MSSKSLAPNFFISDVFEENFLMVSLPKLGTSLNLNMSYFSTKIG